MHEERRIFYENPTPPPTQDEIEEELAYFASEVDRTDISYDGWFVIWERASRHSDLRGATPAQWERFSRFTTIIRQRLDELDLG